METETILVIILGLVAIYLFYKKTPGMTFQEKMKLAGRWAEIEFTEEAFPLGVRRYQLVLYNQGNLEGTIPFSEARREKAEREGYMVLDTDLYKELPDGYKSKPPRESIMDRLEISKWVE
jgi:hypothetical protein